jgi:hypothetical protein
MLEAYISAGLPPGRFWKITPRLYLTEMRGASARLDREFRLLAWAVWHTAYLPRAKDRVSLDKLTGKAPVRKPKPWQAQLAAWRAYAEAKGKT